MKRLLLSLLLFLIINSGFSQGPACPSITAGTVGSQTICSGQCAVLTTTIVSEYLTTSYSVTSIPYAPYAFTGTAFSLNQDDIWSPVENIGFDFCFFGNSYSQLLAGSNGQISFGNLGNSGAYDGWPCTTALPSTTDMPGNMICAAFRDITPISTGACYYQVYGAVPCRYAVITWDNVPLYSCGTPHSTFQCVLYENTNYIDIFIQNSSGSCTSWNGGDGIIGIQNAAATVAVCPPGRNFGTWTANNEAWRFVPTGAAAHTFTWTGPGLSTTATTATVCPTTTSTYTATMVVTNCDGSAYTYTATQQIVVTPGPSVTVNSPSICGGTPATLTAGGATTYSWTPATGLSGTTGSSVTANPSSTTVYSVTGTTGGCSTTVPATVTIAPNPTVTVTSATVCPGTTATLTASGATSYSWSTGATTASISQSPGSTTSYTVKGTTGTCTNSAVGTITIGGSITPTVNSPTICNGASTTLTAAGGTTYTWSPGTGLSGTTGASVTANPTSTTTYTITAASGACTGTVTSVVTVNANPTVTVTSATVCPGATGTLTASGATSYSWSTGATTASISQNPGSTTSYTVTGTINTCTNSAVGTITIGGAITPTVNSPTICNGASTTLTAAGGTTYTWSPGTGLSGTTGASVTANPTGTTTYTITAASGGCTGTVTSVVTVNSNPPVTVTSTSVCSGNSGTITASGATTYTWNTGATTAAITTSPAGTTNYTVTGTTNNCTNTAVGTVSVSASVTVTVNDPIICLGSTTTITATGATTYTWNTGVTTSTITETPATTTSYTVTGAQNGCTGTSVGTVSVVSNPTVTVASATICLNGSVTLTAAGASHYTWTPATGLSSTTTNTVTANPTTTTTYSVVGAAGTCTTSNTGMVTVNPLPTVTASTGTICVGQQTVTLNATGAVTYTWTPATGLTPTTGASVGASPSSTQNYTATGTDANGCVNTGTTSVLVNPLPTVTASIGTICVGQQTVTLNAAGAVTYTWTPATGLTPTTGSVVAANPSSTQNYTITGTDVNGCVNMGTTSVLVNLLPTVTASAGTICIGQQTVTLNAAGAVTYTWTPATGLTTTTGASVAANPSSAQNYTVTGTDANGCVNTGTTSVLVNTLPIVTATSTSVCPTFVGTMTASGASTYVWNTLATGSTLTQTPTTTTPYSVVGTDINGCTNSATATITVYPSPMPVAASNTPCANLTLNLTCTPNGFSDYNWAGPNSYSIAATQNPSITGVTAATAGIYTVFVTDGNGCKNSTTVTVIINPLPVVTAVGSTVCVNQTIALSCLPNAITDTYSWQQQGGPFTSNLENPSIPNATTAMTGNYIVTIRDGNGCASGNVATVLINPLPVVTATSGTICIGQQTATLTATGASTYFWNPSNTLSGSMGAIVTGVPTAPLNIYTVTGTDIHGCTNTAVDSIIVNQLPMVTTNTVSPDCIPLCTTFTASSMPAASIYNWSFVSGQPSSSTAASPQVCFNTSGTFPVRLTVTDNQGCVNTATTSVTAFAIPVAAFGYGPQPVGILAPEVQFTNESTPGLPYYNWNFGDVYSTPANNLSTLINPSHLYSVVDTFFVTLTVSTISGCSATVTEPIVINEMYTLYVPNAFTPNGDGKNEIFLAEGVGINGFKMYIFDRWGLLLFYSEDITKGWDGTYQAKGTQVLKEDVYVWKIVATDFQNTAKNLHGTVTLVK